MTNRNIRAIGAGILVAIWLGLALGAWFGPAKETSDAERRPLKQWPGITAQSVLKGDFMKKFESYTLDQFPMRDSFRQLKSVMHYYGLHQKDNNGIYLADGYATKMEYPYQPKNVAYALRKFNGIYEKYLKDTDSKIYATVVPDKGYYLAEKNGYLAMDYQAMFEDVRKGMPWASYVDVTDLLTEKDYYFTDTHWRQEKILDVAQRLTQAMGAAVPQSEHFTPTAIEHPFYGVYYGQAALPMDPETMYIMQSDVLKDCVVTNYENGSKTTVYDMQKQNSRDLYEIFLSGSVSLLQVENPHATSDKELIIFRDSFGSSIAPLLMEGYKTVTLVDIRYLSSTVLDKYIDFHGQDVLFLYSTLVLNNGTTLK